MDQLYKKFKKYCTCFYENLKQKGYFLTKYDQYEQVESVSNIWFYKSLYSKTLNGIRENPLKTKIYCLGSFLRDASLFLLLKMNIRFVHFLSNTKVGSVFLYGIVIFVIADNPYQFQFRLLYTYLFLVSLALFLCFFFPNSRSLVLRL